MREVRVQPDAGGTGGGAGLRGEEEEGTEAEGVKEGNVDYHLFQKRFMVSIIEADDLVPRKGGWLT